MDFELHRDAAGKFFMQLWSDGPRRRELWKTSESYERRAGVFKATRLAAWAFALCFMDETTAPAFLTYTDFTYETEPTERTLKL